MNRQSDFIPNSFQTPNAYVDNYLHLFSGEEWKALSYAIRRILGFQKRRDRISLSQFSSGIIGEDGHHLDFGCGLSVDTLRRVLANLVRFGFLLRVSENDPKTNEGAEYELQLDDAKINMNALIARGGEKKAMNQKRTAKAKRVLKAKRSQYPLLSDSTRPPIVGQYAPPIVGQYAPPIVGQKHNNQGKPGKTSNTPPTLAQIEEMSVVEALNLPEIQLYKKVTRRIPGQAQWTIIVEFVRNNKPTEDSMVACWKAWRKQDYRPGGLGWMDWILYGIPTFGDKKNGNGKKQKPAVETRLTAQELDEAAADAARQFGVGG